MMERYSEYKDSGVKWLGEIPSHWEVVRGLGVFSENKSKNTQLENSTVLSLSYGKIIVKKDIDSGLVPEEYSSYQIVRPGCIIVRSTDLQNDKTSLRIGYVCDEGIITSAYLGLQVKGNNNDKYLYYFLHDWDITKEIYRHGNGLRQSLSWNDLRDNSVLLPPLSEQDAIVRYLDSATSEIDKAIAMQQKMIDLLNERKQIIIQNAVTKGLDENVEMKESGVEWIGRIPKHWSKDKTMRMFGLYGSGTTPRENIEGGNVPWVNSGDLNNSSLKLAAKFVSEKMVKEISALKVYPKNSIIIAMYGASIGKISISKIECCTNQACFVLSYPYERIKLEYAFYSFMTCKKKWIEQSQGGTQPNINADIIKQTWLALPPLKEQEEIVHFIEEKCNNIEKTIETISRQITLLQERKQIIINEVVTGKVRVS